MFPSFLIKKAMLPPSSSVKLETLLKIFVTTTYQNFSSVSSTFTKAVFEELLWFISELCMVDDTFLG